VKQLTTDDLNLNLAHFDAMAWCSLLNHQCDLTGDVCGCGCHG
jgi:hypothetical protein